MCVCAGLHPFSTPSRAWVVDKPVWVGYPAAAVEELLLAAEERKAIGLRGGR